MDEGMEVLPVDWAPSGAWEDLHQLGQQLTALITEQRIYQRFQPIVDLRIGEVHGYEGLSRGPSDSILQSPVTLFNVAQCVGMSSELEQACCRGVLKAWAAAAMPNKLFLNVSPVFLTQAGMREVIPLEDMRNLGIDPRKIVIELTEQQPTFDTARLLEAARLYRSMGFSIAMDDLGEGFSSLKLWSELRPEYVKVDKHFIRGASQDPVKLHFLNGIRDLARRTGTLVVAEGIEDASDLEVIRDLGMEFGQGYHLGRPHGTPLPITFPNWEQRSAPSSHHHLGRARAVSLQVAVEPVDLQTPNQRVHQRFIQNPGLQSIPVVEDGIPVGLINRHAFLETMARPFNPELLGRRPCDSTMNRSILVVDHQTSLQELSRLMVESDPTHLLFGFVITKEGRYLGMGSGHDLMREITQLQITAARYANPLTLLPGNVPIHEQMDHLLQCKTRFVVAYFDLDHFKPFNDVHGYLRGDELIAWTADILRLHSSSAGDFLGHVGGDDFVMLLYSSHWEQQCLEILAAFQDGVGQFFPDGARSLGGYEAEDRQGRRVFHPLVSLSIGVVQVGPGVFTSHQELSAAAAISKHEAKKIPGNSLFIERRMPPPRKE